MAAVRRAVRRPAVASDVVVEIGTEEQGGRTRQALLAAFSSLVQGHFEAADVACGALDVWGTPRRIALIAAQVEAPRSTTRRELSDALTAALQDALDGLAPLLQSETTVHWLLALWGGRVLPLRIGSLAATRSTRGHRKLAPGVVDVPKAAHYRSLLQGLYVSVQPSERRARLESSLRSAAQGVGGYWPSDPAWLDAWAPRLEWPAIATLSLPAPAAGWPSALLRAALRDRNLGVLAQSADAGAPLAVLVPCDGLLEEQERADRERSLARSVGQLQAAMERDEARTREELAVALAECTWHPRLGSWADKAERVVNLAQRLCEQQGLDSMGQVAGQLGPWLKLDVVSETVREYPSLRGHVSQRLAKRAGVGAELAAGLVHQYAPRPGQRVPDDLLGATLAVADRLDTLVGCFAVGLPPRGSVDPYRLRGAADALVRLGLEGPLDFAVQASLRSAYEALSVQVSKPFDRMVTELLDFLRGRLRVPLSQATPPSVVDACTAAWDAGSMRDLSERVAALSAFCRRSDAADVVALLHRCRARVRDAPAGSVVLAASLGTAEREMQRWVDQLEAALDAALDRRDYPAALERVAALRAPLADFFARVNVAPGDPTVDASRLQLLARITQAVRRVAHFQLLSVQ